MNLLADVGFSTDQILIAVTLACAVIPWAMSIHAKVSSIAQAMEGLTKVVRDTQAKAEQHDGDIRALQRAAGARC